MRAHQPLQLPAATEFTEEVYTNVCNSSTRLGELGAISLDEVAEYQIIISGIQDDPEASGVFMKKYYKPYAQALKSNLQVAAAIMKRVLKIWHQFAC